MRTTDHGEMAATIIATMNDNLYMRVAFSYREPEATEWITRELPSVGFDEEAITIQSFHISYLDEFSPSFRANWFTEAGPFMQVTKCHHLKNL